MKKYEVSYRRRPIDPVFRIVVNASSMEQAREIVKSKFPAARELKIVSVVGK